MLACWGMHCLHSFSFNIISLVRLVDSRDIVELQLKQSDCELMIRKKEALQPPPIIAPAPPPMHYATFPSPSSPLPAEAAPASSAPPKAAPALPSPGKASTSSHPPLKCPMAGTFYRSPAPGEPAFVKVCKHSNIHGLNSTLLFLLRCQFAKDNL